MKGYLLFAVLIASLLLPSLALADHGSGSCGLRGKAKAVGGRVLKLVGRVLPRNR